MEQVNIHEAVLEIVEFWGIDRSLPFELYELEDHLLDYVADTPTLIVLDGWELYNILYTVAETFEFARWEETMQNSREA